MLAEIIKSSYPNYNGGKDVCKYLPLYDEHLPKEISDFMEIGIAMGDSIRAYRDFYQNRGRFHAMNWHWGDSGVISKRDLQREGFICHEGDQGDVQFLKSIKTQFDVIVEDGSHHSDDQIVTFKQMFANNLISGGLYVLEDLHCWLEEYWWRGKVNGLSNTMLEVLKRWPGVTVIDILTDESIITSGQNGFVSQYFTQDESDYYMSLIKDVIVYNPSIAFIWKN